jgi:hypothetical protein
MSCLAAFSFSRAQKCHSATERAYANLRCFAGQRSRLPRSVEHPKTGGSLCKGFGLLETYPFAPSDLPFFEGVEE